MPWNLSLSLSLSLTFRTVSFFTKLIAKQAFECGRLVHYIVCLYLEGSFVEVHTRFHDKSGQNVKDNPLGLS